MQLKKRKKHLAIDIIFLSISIGFTIFLVESEIAKDFVKMFDDVKWLGILFAGLFFTSVFTTAPAIVLLAQFAEKTPLLILAILGGFGAMLGDYILFRIVKDRVSEDIAFLLSFSKRHRIFAIFKTQLFKFFLPFIGGLIIASPLPDELGVTLLGLSKLSDKRFLFISFFFNGLGILAIGWVAKTAIGL